MRKVINTSDLQNNLSININILDYKLLLYQNLSHNNQPDNNRVCMSIYSHGKVIRGPDLEHRINGVSKAFTFILRYEHPKI